MPGCRLNVVSDGIFTAAPIIPAQAGSRKFERGGIKCFRKIKSRNSRAFIRYIRPTHQE
ncbi:hypothetical protein NEILACOT_04785 [Neisseria lactamica ATCC 23970]|uniref:Uncharacterized protein n=1 Tax=Neisseria lactamica ATCC 23970 TaxID=546265 RepID=D0WB61_NEILA|nr:hypothetical protein NEILACOT_04785 [Neisseria lactamica ATCC 23970]